MCTPHGGEGKEDPDLRLHDLPGFCQGFARWRGRLVCCVRLGVDVQCRWEAVHGVNNSTMPLPS